MKLSFLSHKTGLAFLLMTLGFNNTMHATENPPKSNELKNTYTIKVISCDKPEVSGSLVYFWIFDTSLPNNTPLESIDASYGLVSGGQITYQSALSGYPFDPDHPNWRKASMERRNSPTPLNYRPEGNGGVSFDNSNMRGIQVKQPFTGDGGENTMTLHLPTNDFSDVVLKFAAKDEGAADNLVVDYSIASGAPQWITTGLSNPNPTLTDEYQLYVFDFSGIAGADNNPDFKVRVRFDGSDMSADDGNRVTFNNISFDGVSSGSVNLPPVIVQPVELQQVIEAGNPFVIDLNEVFEDPDGDPLTFAAQSNRPSMVQASVSGSTLTANPLLRGDAIITVMASDGINSPVGTEFRALVYPEAFPLANGQFSFDAWDPDEPEYSYPQHMMFMQGNMSDPGLNDPLVYPYFIPHSDYHPDDELTIGFPYNNTRRTRINGLGEDGISFINTGRDRDLGGAILAIDTRGVTEANLEWLGGTILQNERIYAIRLQYRTSIDELFTDLTNNNQVVEYLTGQDDDVTVFENIQLPPDALGQEYVQLQWKYYHVIGNSGPRAELRIDDIIFKDLTSITVPLSGIAHVSYDGSAIQVILSKPITGIVQVYDVTGRLVAEGQMQNSGNEALALRAAPGVFIVRVTDYESTWTKKLFVY